VRDETGADGCPHPNDVDRKRIERALARRKRYRYVSPRVHATENGYRIESPCCSRNVDPAGGMIDIALLQYDPLERLWRLYRKDHRSQRWLLDAELTTLAELLDRLNGDPERRFWQ
jgi:hypothetical protein